MEDRAAMKAAGAGQQTVESSGTSHVPVPVETDKPRAKKAAAPGLTFQRFFTEAGVDPFDEIEWELRSAVIGSQGGEVVFEQRDVEIPKSWSQQATNIVVSKYFRGQMGAPERERSVKQLIGRVVDTITMWGRNHKYFASDADLSAFSDDLKHILVYQKAAFNSPVWFNCGFEKAPQCSACFINSVQDTMDSILTLARTEGMLFKFGSGTGTNLSPIRSSKELLAGGGTASGPVSFMKGYDAFAGVIKSGGKTRRAAKMVILDAQHPDIVEFINCKVEEEKKAWALIDAGYDGSFTGPAYSSVFFQNSNNSVRVTDEFMRAVLDDGVWETKAVRDGAVVDRYQARDLMRLIAEGTHVCGDPGMQFDTTINEWHTCPETDRIFASNPCSEYMFLNDSACNLASINLMKFVKADGEFDVVSYKAAIQTLITAQEIIVDNASYPSESIGKNSHAYRPLGLGYANLGALLMSRGLPYDSDAGRDYAAALTAMMTGEAYAQSARIARDQGGPFTGYEKNREPFLRVMRKHRDSMRDVNARNVPSDLYQAREGVVGRCRRTGRAAWLPQRAGDRARADRHHRLHDGLRHDRCGAGHRARQVQEARRRRHDEDRQPDRADGAQEARLHAGAGRRDHQLHQRAGDHRRRAGLKDSHLPVFDCAFKAAKGQRSIHYMGHIKMMGATQPFISGAISKTVNVPKDATVDDIKEAYIQSWKLGAKAISIYRDGSKRTQPLNTSKDKTAAEIAQQAAASMARADSPEAPGRTPGPHAQVRHPGARGLHHRRPVRRRPAGRDLPRDGEGRLDDLGLCRRVRAGDFLRAAVRRAAPGAGRQVQPRPVRAVGHDEEPGDPLREVDRRLHLPVDGNEVPLEGSAVPRRRQRAGAR